MTEEEILWDLPLSRGFAYLHAAMIRDGADMRWSGVDTPQDNIMQKARDLMKRKPWRN